MKRLLELDADSGDVIDDQFIREHTSGFDALRAQLAALPWDTLCAGTGLTPEEFDTAAGVYAGARSVILAYGMGITQHRHGTGNVQQIANLLLMRGNMGRPGAGICPVRGHSNVQGDRTVGINERPPEEFLSRLDASFGLRSPRKHGVTVSSALCYRPRRHPGADLTGRQRRRRRAGSGDNTCGAPPARSHGRHHTKLIGATCSMRARR